MTWIYRAGCLYAVALLLLLTSCGVTSPWLDDRAGRIHGQLEKMAALMLQQSRWNLDLLREFRHQLNWREEERLYRANFELWLQHEQVKAEILCQLLRERYPPVRSR